MAVESRCEIIEIECNAVRFVRPRRPRDQLGIPGEFLDQGEFAFVGETRWHRRAAHRGGVREVREGLLDIAEHRLRPRVPHLHVKYRILLRLLNHFGEVEVERSVVLAIQHHEPHGIGADLVDDVAHGDEGAGPLAHLERLAVLEQPDELAEDHIEIALAVGDGRDRRLQALFVARVIGAEHIDHVRETAVPLGLVIGDVGRKVGVAAVRLEQRAIAVIAECGRAEQRLLAILPVGVEFAFRRFEPALEDVTGGPQRDDRLGDHVPAALGQ